MCCLVCGCIWIVGGDVMKIRNERIADPKSDLRDGYYMLNFGKEDVLSEYIEESEIFVFMYTGREINKHDITREQIKIYQGVLSKRINYIELYRVYDYEEKQSFIQSLINNTNIYIYSGDKSTPELLMNGLKANSDIIQTIRNRVEEQKKKKGIYEFTNR